MSDDTSIKTKTEVDPRNSLNDLTSKEWVPETVSVWIQKGLEASHPDAKIERKHPAPFSFTDISRLIRFFTKRGGVVLDPFVGVGSTLKACALEGRIGIGFELNPLYVELTKERLSTEVRDLWANTDEQVIKQGDARDLIKSLPENSLDFVVTSPPYWSWRRYSALKIGTLGNWYKPISTLEPDVMNCYRHILPGIMSISITVRSLSKVRESGSATSL